MPPRQKRRGRHRPPHRRLGRTRVGRARGSGEAREACPSARLRTRLPSNSAGLPPSPVYARAPDAKIRRPPDGDRRAIIAISDGSCDDLDAVMTVMNAAFGRRYGEAWTRSHARDPADERRVARRWPGIGRPTARRLLAGSLTLPTKSELLLIAVLPAHHRRGVGRRLLEDFVERCRNEGIKQVHLEVRDGNPAVEMYRMAGFDAVGRRRNYYRSPDGTSFDAITLASQL